MAWMPCTSRPYRGPDDLPAVFDLLARRPPAWINVYPALTDLREMAGTPQGLAGLRLWEDGAGRLAAFALLDGGFLAFETAPEAPFAELAGRILDWAEQGLASAPDAPEVPDALETGCREEDAPRRAYLEGQGFAAQPVRTLHFRRALAGPIPPPQLPPGFRIRPTRGEVEAAAWVDLHRAAHASQAMTLDYRLAMLRAPEHRPDLDLVAVSPDDRLAAYGVGYFSPEENRLSGQAVGYTDPVATHPDFQGRGLARALLLAALARLQSAGLETAEVSTWGENTAMIRTAESVGYRCYSSTLFYARPLPARAG